MKCKLLNLTLLFSIIVFQVDAQTITFRFANPVSYCDQAEVCYDVEAQADVAGVELDEFNMRMYMDNCQLDFIDFRNPDANYALETGGEAQLGVPGAGMSFFGFDGDFVYITDNLQRVAQTATEMATAPDWSYLFEACFAGVSTCLGDPILNTLIFGTGPDGLCPSLVFDHDMDGTGFASGSDGVEALAVNPSGGPGLTLVEAVVNTNWDYYEPDSSLGECAPLCGPLAIPSVVSATLTVNKCNDINLFWNIEAETNTDKYIIERRYDGILKWESLGEMIGMNQTASYQYEFKDDQNLRSNVRVYYQLKHVNFDKQVHTVGSISSMLDCEGEDVLMIFPNPSNGPMNFSFNVLDDQSLIKADVIDLNGKLVMANIIHGKYDNGFFQERLNTSSLLPGEYLLRMEKAEELVSIPFVVYR